MPLLPNALVRSPVPAAALGAPKEEALPAGSVWEEAGVVAGAVAGGEAAVAAEAVGTVVDAVVVAAVPPPLDAGSAGRSACAHEFGVMASLPATAC